MKIITLQGKEYRGEIIAKGNDCRNLDIYKVRLEDGRVGMVHADNIKDEETKEEKMLSTLKSELKANNIEFYSMEDYVGITTDSEGLDITIGIEEEQYDVYICEREEINNFGDYNEEVLEDKYYKTVKGAIRLVKKYVG